ncbi:MAG: GNAT family N-acetyltransferase [Anaerolineaceae bacterium]
MHLFENTPTMLTDRLVLRKFTPQDVGDLFSILSDEEVNTFLPWFPLKSLEETAAFLDANYLRHYQKESVYRYAVCKRADNRPIGYVDLSDGEGNDFGYGLRKEFWGRGYITEACTAVIGRLKANGYPFITATHDVNNPASGNVMKRLGMRYCYSYVEQWQPKNIFVTFRMYQLNLDGDTSRVYRGYWERYTDHFIEPGV